MTLAVLIITAVALAFAVPGSMLAVLQLRDRRRRRARSSRAGVNKAEPPETLLMCFSAVSVRLMTGERERPQIERPARRKRWLWALGSAIAAHVALIALDRRMRLSAGSAPSVEPKAEGRLQPWAALDRAGCDDRTVSKVVDLLSRPTYGLAQIDSLLGLQSGTAKRWIDGYTRAGKHYEPVVREHSTGEELATWGELLETRLLAEYRDAGVPMIHMRPAVQALREELRVPYPLASARIWLRPEGRELARVVEEKVNLDQHLALVVVRTGQALAWSAEADRFRSAIDWTGKGEDAQPRRLRPVANIDEVVIDPLLGFGEPVVRGVRTEIIRELVEAGESQESIAEVYELPKHSVEAAVRYELLRARSVAKAA